MNDMLAIASSSSWLSLDEIGMRRSCNGGRMFLLSLDLIGLNHKKPFILYRLGNVRYMKIGYHRLAFLIRQIVSVSAVIEYCPLITISDAKGPIQLAILINGK